MQIRKKRVPLQPHLEKCIIRKRFFHISRLLTYLFAKVQTGMIAFEEKAEIAQSVEHNLAKVGVAGPSPVFRSLIEQKRVIRNGLMFMPRWRNW